MKVINTLLIAVLVLFSTTSFAAMCYDNANRKNSHVMYINPAEKSLNFDADTLYVIKSRVIEDFDDYRYTTTINYFKNGNKIIAILSNRIGELGYLVYHGTTQVEQGICEE